MARRKKRSQLPAEPVTVEVEKLSHDGRGVTHIDGKTVFIDRALPGEQVVFTYSASHRRFDEGQIVEVLRASPDRVEPRCPHFGVCGGCALQHLSPDAQINLKQTTLAEQFHHMGKVEPGSWLPPLIGPLWGYRRKARLGVKYVIKKERLLVGFRERRNAFLADISRCEVLHPSVGERIAELAELIADLEAYNRIAQIEVAVDDTTTALVLRNLDPLSEADQARLIEYAKAQGIALLLQPGGPDSVTPLWPEEGVDLHYRLPEHDLDLHFGPTDFTQVNAQINREMIALALGLLEPCPEDRVLDLFCGLGNFTLPIARRCKAVVGVEGDPALVAHAEANAERNDIGNATFHAADLIADLSNSPWWEGGFDKVLLDPPRSGAEETLSHLARLGIGRIVYVSCNPATLARDAGILVNEFGYTLERAGVMDMFPHTAHVESIALFTRKGKKGR